MHILDSDAVCCRATLSFMQRKLASDRREPRCEKYVHTDQFQGAPCLIIRCGGRNSSTFALRLRDLFTLSQPSTYPLVTPIPIIALEISSRLFDMSLPLLSTSKFGLFIVILHLLTSSQGKTHPPTLINLGPSRHSASIFSALLL